MMPLLGIIGGGEGTKKIFGSDNVSRTILQGRAANTDSITTLMTDGSSQSAGAWYNQPLDLSRTRSIEFTSNLSGSADGFAVSFQPTSVFPTQPGLGGGGGNIGLSAGNALYVGFRTYTSNGLYIMNYGSGSWSGQVYSNGWTGTYKIKVSVTPAGQVTVLYNDTQVYTGAHVAPPSPVWIGVVAGTGGSSETQYLSLGVVA